MPVLDDLDLCGLYDTNLFYTIAIGMADRKLSVPDKYPDVKYVYGSTIKMTFSMPEHDVIISLGSTPYGSRKDNNI